MNAKIERTIKEINKTKDSIAELQTKLRTLEQQKIDYENEEIIAMFRKEKLTEVDLAAYIKSRRGDGKKNGGGPPDTSAETVKEDEAVEN